MKKITLAFIATIICSVSFGFGISDTPSGLGSSNPDPHAGLDIRYCRATVFLGKNATDYKKIIAAGEVTKRQSTLAGRANVAIFELRNGNQNYDVRLEATAQSYHAQGQQRPYFILQVVQQTGHRKEVLFNASDVKGPSTTVEIGSAMGLQKFLILQCR